MLDFFGERFSLPLWLYNFHTIIKISVNACMFTWHVLMATGFWMAYFLYGIWCFAPTLQSFTSTLDDCFKRIEFPNMWGKIIQVDYRTICLLNTLTARGREKSLFTRTNIASLRPKLTLTFHEATLEILRAKCKDTNYLHYLFYADDTHHNRNLLAVNFAFLNQVG
ncbi:hypothetical protein ACJX0J_029079 [Zea mays]